MAETPRTAREEARRVGDAIGVDWSRYDLEQFRAGMDVEFEHGADDPQTDVTGDDRHRQDRPRAHEGVPGLLRAPRADGTRGRARLGRTGAVTISNDHRDTLEKILRHPASGNIEWRLVKSLLEAVGTATERGQRKAQGRTRRRNGGAPAATGIRTSTSRRSSACDGCSLVPVSGARATTSDGVSLLERIRRLWASQPDPDHPLTEEERERSRRPPATTSGRTSIRS